MTTSQNSRTAEQQNSRTAEQQHGRTPGCPRSLLCVLALSLLAMLPPLCRAQDRPTPSPTATIDPTPVPTVTPTPAKSNQSAGTPFSNAASPSPTIRVPRGQPSPVAIRTEDQPPPGDPQNPTIIEWVTYTPPTNGPDGTARWPVIVVLHIGGFHGGNFYQSLDNAPQELAAAGFYVVVADYPLAPPNSIKNQDTIQQNDPTHSGRYPQQTRAIQAVIDAAKKDDHCYHGIVGVLGGSAGASHGAYIALDVTFTNNLWPYWSSTARPKAVACLSGQYDFSDREGDVDTNFIDNIENYTYTTIPVQQWLDSPIGRVGGVGSNGFIPMYCLRASDDPGSPKTNSDYFWYTMTHNGASSPTFTMWEVPDANMDHAFALWNDYTQDNSDTNYKVSERVIAFFQQYLHD